MRFPWQSSPTSQKNPHPKTPSKRNKKKFLPAMELLERRDMLAATIISAVNTSQLLSAIATANTGGNTAGYIINLSGGATYDTSGGAFKITSVDPVTIQVSGGVGGDATINGQHFDRVFDIGPKSTVTLNYLQIEDGSATVGGGIDSYPGAKLTLNNDIVEDNTATQAGGGIAAGYEGFSYTSGTYSGGSLTVSNSTIEDNTVSGSTAGTALGGGIAASGQYLALHDSTIEDNKADGVSSYGEGGGVYVDDPNQVFKTGTNVVIDTGTQITGNTADGSSVSGGLGGGLYINRLDSASISNATISGNVAGGAANGTGGAGGGVYLTNLHAVSGNAAGGSVTFTNVTINCNTADGSESGVGGGKGGGLYIAPGENVQFTGSCNLIQGNLAAGAGTSSGGSGGSGGGIYADGAIVKLTNTTIGGTSAWMRNVAGGAYSGGYGGAGGGVFFKNLGSHISGTGASQVLSSLTISGGAITKNLAAGSGISGGSSYGFSGGAAEGGGIFAEAAGAYVSGTTQVSITNVTISGNSAQGGLSGGNGGLGGGIALVGGLSATISGSCISGNSADGASSGSSGGAPFGGVGGGIYLNGSILNLTSDTISGNSAQGGISGGGGAGGGIFANNLGENLNSGGTQSSLTISGGCITDNNAEGGDFGKGSSGAAGGGIFAGSYYYYSGGTQLSITNAIISCNTAQGGFSGGEGGVGGGIWLSPDLSATISGSTISLNNATAATGGYNVDQSNYGGSGGGIYTWASILQLTNDTISCNTAKGNYSGGGGTGGGIVDDDLGAKLNSGGTQATLTISGGCISYNVASGGGFSGGGSAAAGFGGGIYATSDYGELGVIKEHSTNAGVTRSGAIPDSEGYFPGGTQISITCATIAGNVAQGGFSGGEGGEGGGLALFGAMSVNITNSVIASNKADAASGGPFNDEPDDGGTGGGIYADGIILKLTSDTIGGPSCYNGNVAQGAYSGGGGLGGGIFFTDLGEKLTSGGTQSSLTISGGCIQNNRASGGGFSGGNSFAAGEGGGIYAYAWGCYSGGTQITITNANILCNTAQGGFSGGAGAGGAGGGIFLDQNLSVNISGSNISGNIATGASGGSLVGPSVTLSPDEIGGRNNGGGSGGGIFATDDILLLTSTNVCGNTAEAGCDGYPGAGGGIFIKGLGDILSGGSGGTIQSSLTISGGSVNYNSAEGGFSGGGQGGGIAANGNTGFSGGSGGYSGGTQVKITGTAILGNYAGGSYGVDYSSGGGFSGGVGGGILLYGPMSATISNATISCNVAAGSCGSGGGGGGGGGIADIYGILTLTSTTVGGASGSLSGGNIAGGDTNYSGGAGAGGGIFDPFLGDNIGTSAFLAVSTLSISGGSVSDNTACGGDVDGAGGGGILAVGEYSSGGAELTISGVLINGNAAYGGEYDSGVGGGLLVADITVNVSGGSFSNNLAGGAYGSGGYGGSGGGIFSYDSIVRLSNTTVSGNVAAGGTNVSGGRGGQGGGIYAADLGAEVGESAVSIAALISNSSVSGDTAIVTAPATLTITGSTISSNTASNASSGGYDRSASGGGIFAEGYEYLSGGAFNMSDSTVTGNYIGAVSGGTEVVADVYEYADQGAGIALVGVNANISQCTIDHNTIGGNSGTVTVSPADEIYEGGAGIYIGYSAAVTIINSTIAYNTATTGVGGGIFVTSDDELGLANDTIAYNVACVGGGIFRYGSSGGAQTEVWNTIVAENFSAVSGGTETDLYGYFDSLGHNLIGSNAGSTGFTQSAYAASIAGNTKWHHVADANGDIVGGTVSGGSGPLSTYEVGLSTSLVINPLPSPYGPVTVKTLALLQGSLAVGNGDTGSQNFEGTTVSIVTLIGNVDERGYQRINGTYKTIDIGAYQTIRGHDDT